MKYRMIRTSICSAVGFLLGGSFVACEGRNVVADLTITEDTTRSDSGSGSDNKDEDTDSESEINVGSDSETDVGSDSETDVGSDSETDVSSDSDSMSTDTEWECGRNIDFSIPGNVYIDIGNKFDLEKYSPITHLRGTLSIHNLNADNVDLSVFNELMCIDGDLMIMDVTELENLDIFSNLKRVRKVFIVCNPDLVDLSAISQLQVTKDNYVIISGNQSLPTCKAAEFLDSISTKGWSGNSCIIKNDRDTCNENTDNCPHGEDEILCY